MSDFNQNNDDEDIVVTLDLDDGSQVECARRKCFLPSG